ncbi:MAG: metallophosphoesterase [Pseudomonadota bacterium]
MDGLSALEHIKLAIYYASYLYFLAAPFALRLVMRRTGPVRIFTATFFVIITCLAYGRFVEPRILLTNEHDIALQGCFENAGEVRVVVFSDTHNGLFGNAMAIERIAKRVQAAGADAVLIAGDFVYFLDPVRMEETYAAFAQIEAPVFGVLGNHDLGIPGPDLRAPLMETLPTAGVALIDNRAVNLAGAAFAVELVGLSDHWDGRQELSLLEEPTSTPRLALTHNPGAVKDFTADMAADLLIGGHTHGGQIQLPLITCWLTGMCGDVAYGLREAKGFQIFTTSGTGMVGLPMRFRVPPRIDVLNVSYKACAAE